MIVPNEDESYSPLEREKVPACLTYSKDKQGLTYTVEYFKNLAFEKVRNEVKPPNGCR